MRIIIIDGFHKGHVIDLPHAALSITLPKPKTITVCSCDDPYETPGKFDFASSEITYQCAFRAIDGKIALYSRTGDSTAIFDSGFAHVWRDKPWEREETLWFGCHDYRRVAMN